MFPEDISANHPCFSEVPNKAARLHRFYLNSRGLMAATIAWEVQDFLASKLFRGGSFLVISSG